MGDIMRPVPFAELITRIVGEYRNHHSIFGIAEEQFYQDKGKNSISVFGQSIKIYIVRVRAISTTR